MRILYTDFLKTNFFLIKQNRIFFIIINCNYRFTVQKRKHNGFSIQSCIELVFSYIYNYLNLNKVSSFQKYKKKNKK